MSLTCLAAWMLALILLPIVILLWATESQPQRIHRLRSYGWSYKRISDHMNITQYKVRKALAA